MKTIDKIIEELTDKNSSLTGVLIKTKVLAHKLKNQELTSWINSELTGYSYDEVPEYRILSCEIRGTVSNVHSSYVCSSIPLDGLKEIPGITDEDIKKWRNLNMPQGISSLEESIQVMQKNKGKKFGNVLPFEWYPLLSESFDNGFVVESASRQVQHTQIIQLLDTVRTKLLDFLLKLNDELDETEDEDEKTLINKNKTMTDTQICEYVLKYFYDNRSRGYIDAPTAKFFDNKITNEEINRIIKYLYQDGLIVWYDKDTHMDIMIDLSKKNKGEITSKGRISIEHPNQLPANVKPPLTQNIHISESKNIQVGDKNIMNNSETNQIQMLLDAIDRKNEPQEKKEEAKGLIRRVIDNPLFNTVLSGILGNIDKLSLDQITTTVKVITGH